MKIDEDTVEFGWPAIRPGRPDKERAHRPQRWCPIATDEEAMPLHWPRRRHHPLMSPTQVELDKKPDTPIQIPRIPQSQHRHPKLRHTDPAYNATRASCCASAILAPHSGAPIQENAQSPQKTSPIEEGWLYLLRWLPPSKLSKMGLFRGSHGRRPTTTGPLRPFFLLCLCHWVIVEDVLIIPTPLNKSPALIPNDESGPGEVDRGPIN